MKKLIGNSVVCGGVFYGGEIEPGTFHGGEIEPGTFHGGEIEPGTFHGSVDPSYLLERMKEEARSRKKNGRIKSNGKKVRLNNNSEVNRQTNG